MTEKQNCLTPIQLDKLARVMVWALERARASAGPGGVYSAGEVVVLVYERCANDLAERVYPLLLRKGLRVVLRPIPHFAMEPLLFDNAEPDQISFVGNWDLDLAEKINGRILLRAPESLTHLKDCDPNKLAMRSRALRPITEIRSARENKGEYAWTLCSLPTEALAAQAKMTLAEYVEQVVLACYLDEEDPVARWTQTMEQTGRIMRWLTDMPIDHIHLKSDDGRTDLKVWIGQERRWRAGSGRNIPSFEVFTSPEAGRAEGVYCATEPSFSNGHYVRGVRLVFRNGEVAEATSDTEQKFLLSRVAMDEGSRRLGEFSLTDKRFSAITRFMADTLYDENVGGPNGNSHVAIGKSFEDCFSGDVTQLTPERSAELGFNKSALHWDLVNTAPRTATAYLRDGTSVVIYRDGMFTLPL